MTRTNKNASARAGVREDMQQLLLSDGHVPLQLGMIGAAVTGR